MRKYIYIVLFMISSVYAAYLRDIPITVHQPDGSVIECYATGDKVEVYKDEPPIDTVLGVEIFPVIHVKTKEEIYVSLEDIK